jgi:hypothetical protein
LAGGAAAYAATQEEEPAEVWCVGGGVFDGTRHETEEAAVAAYITREGGDPSDWTRTEHGWSLSDISADRIDGLELTQDPATGMYAVSGTCNLTTTP